MPASYAVPDRFLGSQVAGTTATTGSIVARMLASHDGSRLSPIVQSPTGGTDSTGPA